MFCKHRVRILCGGVDGIVSDNHADVIMLSEWLRGTDVETALQAVVSLEREADRIKRALSDAKKALSRALHD